jgi:hypothetical protein
MEVNVRVVRSLNQESKLRKNKANQVKYFSPHPPLVPLEIHNPDPWQDQHVFLVLPLAYDHAPLEYLEASASLHIL